jgi:hypothetical protein
MSKPDWAPPDSSDFTAMIDTHLKVIVFSISYFLRREKSRITLNYIGSISSFSNWKNNFLTMSYIKNLLELFRLTYSLSKKIQIANLEF